MFLGGNLLSRSALAVNAASASPLLGFTSIAAATSDTITLPPGYSASVLISWGQPLHKNARLSTRRAMAQPRPRNSNLATTTTA